MFAPLDGARGRIQQLFPGLIGVSSVEYFMLTCPQMGEWAFKPADGQW